MSNDDNVFSWRRDFKHVNWGGTLKYNTLRAAGAGIVWFVLALLAGAKWQSFTMLLFPLFYFVSFLPFGLLTAWLSGLGVPWVGLFAAFVALMVGVGDPLVFILKKSKPELVPVDKAPFFSLKTVIFLLNEPTPDLADSPEKKEISSSMFVKK